MVYGGSVSRTDSYTYASDWDNNIEQIVTGSDSDITITPEWDINNRYTGSVSQIADVTLTEGITYYKQGNHGTNLPKVYSYVVKKGDAVKSSGQMSVTYDASENISGITVNGAGITYTYDSLGRLEKEVNEQLGQTYIFTYDNNGNILTKKIGNTTINYAYDGDKLVSYNGQACVYDAVGNPTTYRGKTATWVRGRKLASFDGNTFTYDALGKRLSKNDIKFWYDSNGRLLKQSNGQEFFYDVVGVIAIKYNGVTYLCRKDLQGNIIALIDNNGTTVVQYNYDAWGNQQVLDATGNAITDTTNIGILNPFRYRSYYFDVETGLYYLQTRYYDPEVGRFLNIDSLDYADPETINGLNLYAYCNNNPILYVDPTGHAWWHWLIAAAAVVVLAAATAISAGGVLLGASAISAATIGTTAVGASAVTTTLAYATVGAGVALAASGVYAGITATENGIKSGSISTAVNDFFDYGETALYSTLAGGLYGSGAGMLTYYEQIGNSKQSGFMTQAQRNSQKQAYWRGQGNKNGKASPGMEISHIYGTYGNNRNYFIVQTHPDHIAFHMKYGFKTSGSCFNRLNPFYHNWWEEIQKFLGL